MGKQIRYTAEFKIHTVQMYLQGNLSANQLAINLGIHPHTVRHWIQDYNDGKMRCEVPLVNERTDRNNITLHGQQEASTRPDIGIVISKISTLEYEIKELKSILQSYLLKW